MLTAAVAGCQTSGGFRAADLPPQFQAPLVRSTQSLDLSQLARAGSGSEVIQSGDMLALSVTTGLNGGEPEPKLLRVADEGTLDVPLVGPIPVAGLQLPVAELAIRNASMRGNVYRSPQVSLQFQSRQGNAVTVLGAVKTPGTYRLGSANSNVLGALVAAGGLDDLADTTIEIHHPPTFDASDNQLAQLAGGVQPANYRQPAGPRAFSIDLSQANMIPDQALRVHDGTAIMVRPRQPQMIYVMGLVNRPGQFEAPLDDELRLLDALALAGGRRLEIADKVRVTRRASQFGESITIRASVREAQQNEAANIRLAAGDVVQVEETTMTFTLETMRNFVRLGITTGVPGI